VTQPGGEDASAGRGWRPGGFAAALAAILVAAALVQAWPGAPGAMEFRRAGIAAGQWWRLLTGNLVHFSWLNLAANAAAFALLCAVARSRGLPAISVLVGFALAVGLGVYLFARGIESYRGLSGVSFALLAMVLVDMALARRSAVSAVWVGVLALLAGRAVFEAATGRALLPTSLPAGPCVVGAAHLAGLAAGSAAGLAQAARRRRAPAPA